MVEFLADRCNDSNHTLRMQRLGKGKSEVRRAKSLLVLASAAVTWCVWCIATPAWAQGCTPTESDSGVRPPLVPRPEARADAHSTEAGKRDRIDVLANDVGVRPGPNNNLKIKDQPICGKAGVEGRYIWYKANDDCAGKKVLFEYSAKLQDARTCEDEWRSAPVAITVKPRAVSCDVPNSNWRMIKVGGGQFTKDEAPERIRDFVKLLNEPAFTVSPFCITADAISAAEFERFFMSISPEQRKKDFPEAAKRTTNGGSLGDGDPDFVPPIMLPGSESEGPANKISRRMALAYAKHQSEKKGRALTLPTLNEYVATTWELSTQERSREFIDALRSGNLQWTSTPCPQTDPEPGSFLMLGPGARGPLSTLCYDEFRLDARTGFRLIVR